MARDIQHTSVSAKASSFRIEGQIQREQPECQPGETKLAAYVFDRAGTLLGSGSIDAKGSYSVAVQLTEPADMKLLLLFA